MVAALLLPLFVLAYIYLYSMRNANSPNHYLTLHTKLTIEATCIDFGLNHHRECEQGKADKSTCGRKLV